MPAGRGYSFRWSGGGRTVAWQDDAVIPDLRVCFVGDSFVAGAGDPQQRGWVGRIAVRTYHADQPMTSYNLGIRRDTSDDVITRWHVECAPRLPPNCTGMIVFSFGVNDTVIETGQPRVSPGRCASNLTALLIRGPQQGWPILVAGPPPVADDQHNERISGLNQTLQHICRAYQTPYVDVFRSLQATSVWMREVRDGDGAHPSAGGYAAYADLVWPHWSAWLSAA